MTWADPEAMARAVDGARATRDPFVAAEPGLRALRDEARARCGRRAVGGEAVEGFARLLTSLAETEQRIDEVRVDLVDADAPRWSPHRATSPSWAGVDWRAPGPRRSPWLDPRTDSWVVNLLALGAGRRPTPELIARLRAEGPEVLSTLTDRELGTAHQIHLLATDPARFAANWIGAAEGALGGLAGLVKTGAGVAGLLVPGLDDTTEALFDRRLGHETRALLLDRARLAIDDPDALAASSIGWDELREDPYRWLGAAVPGAVAQGLTGGASPAVLRWLRPARVPDRSVSPGGAVPPAGRYPDLDVHRRGEPEWGPPGEIVSHRQAPHEPPEGWVADVNGEGLLSPGRSTNCIDCARAVEANWRGQDAVAAPLDEAFGPGAAADRLEEWTGGRLVPASVSDIGAALEELGPGSSAIITSRWHTGGAHAYNAVNDGGVVKWVDGQLGRVSRWPPPYADEVDVSIVILVDAEGRPL